LDGSQKNQKTLPGTIEIRPLAIPPQAPGAFVPARPAPDSKDFPTASLAGAPYSQFTSLPDPASISLAKAVPEASGSRASPLGQVWVVQVASYAREADARAFAAKLQSKRYNLSIVPGEVAGQPRYRVEIGPLPTRDDAHALQKELAVFHKIEPTLLLLRTMNPTSAALAR
jgi:cell division septation protein DedD